VPRIALPLALALAASVAAKPGLEVKRHVVRMKGITEVEDPDNRNHDLGGFKSAKGDKPFGDVATMFCVTIRGKRKAGVKWKDDHTKVCEIYGKAHTPGAPKGPTSSQSALKQCADMARSLGKKQKLVLETQFWNGLKKENGHGRPGGLYVGIGSGSCSVK
jgi:hypothetical protein